MAKFELKIDTRGYPFIKFGETNLEIDHLDIPNRADAKRLAESLVAGLNEAGVGTGDSRRHITIAPFKDKDGHIKGYHLAISAGPGMPASIAAPVTLTEYNYLLRALEALGDLGAVTNPLAKEGPEGGLRVPPPGGPVSEKQLGIWWREGSEEDGYRYHGIDSQGRRSPRKTLSTLGGYGSEEGVRAWLAKSDGKSLDRDLNYAVDEKLHREASGEQEALEQQRKDSLPPSVVGTEATGAEATGAEGTGTEGVQPKRYSAEAWTQAESRLKTARLKAEQAEGRNPTNAELDAYVAQAMGSYGSAASVQQASTPYEDMYEHLFDVLGAADDLEGQAPIHKAVMKNLEWLKNLPEGYADQQVAHIKSGGYLDRLIAQAREFNRNAQLKKRAAEFSAHWQSAIIDDLQRQIDAPDAFTLSSDDLASLKLTVAQAKYKLPDILDKYLEWYTANEVPPDDASRGEGTLDYFNLGLPAEAAIVMADFSADFSVVEAPANFLEDYALDLHSYLRPDVVAGESMSQDDITDTITNGLRRTADELRRKKDGLNRFNSGWNYHIGAITTLLTDAVSTDRRRYERILLDMATRKDDFRDGYWSAPTGTNPRTFLNDAFIEALQGEFLHSVLLDSITPGNSVATYRDLGIAQQSLAAVQAFDSKYATESPGLVYRQELETLYANHLAQLQGTMRNQDASKATREEAGRAHRMIRDAQPRLMSSFAAALRTGTDVTPFDYFNQSIPEVLGDGTASASESLSLIGRDTRRANMVNQLINAGYDRDIAEVAVGQHWPTGAPVDEVVGEGGATTSSVDVRGEPLISEVQKAAKNLQANRAGTQYLEAALPLHTAQQAATLPAGTPIAPPVGLGAPVDVPQTATGEHAFLPGGGAAPMSPAQTAAATQTAQQGVTGLAFMSPQTPEQLEALVVNNEDFQKRNAAYKAITGKDLLDELRAGGVFDTTKFPANATRGDLFSKQVEDHITSAEAGAREVEAEMEDTANLSGLSLEEVKKRQKEINDPDNIRSQMLGDEEYLKSVGASQSEIDLEAELLEKTTKAAQKVADEAAWTYQPSGISQTMSGITTKRRRTR